MPTLGHQEVQDTPASRFWRDRRATLLAIAIGLSVFGLAWISTGSYEKAWRSVGVDATPIPFGDLRYLLNAVDCDRIGEDPYINANCDMWGRKYDYPRPWLQLSRTGISASLTSPIGALLSVVLLLAIFVIFESRGIFGFIVTILSILSPPVFFVIERGNIDIVIFSTLVLSIYILNCLGEIRRNISLISIIVMATSLKLYPIAFSSVFIGQKRQLLLISAAAIGSITAVLLTTSMEDIFNIGMTTPIDSMLSYGSSVLPLVIRFGYPTSFDTCCYVLDDSVRLLRVYASLAALLTCIPLAWIGHRFSSPISKLMPGVDAPWLEISIVKGCLSVFCFTYILGTNYDYRQIFVVGLLAGLIRLDNIHKNTYVRLFCALLIAFIWTSRVSESLYSLDDVIAFAIFSIGVVWMSAMAFSALRQSASVAQDLPGNTG